MLAPAFGQDRWNGCGGGGTSKKGAAEPGLAYLIRKLSDLTTCMVLICRYRNNLNCSIHVIPDDLLYCLGAVTCVNHDTSLKWSLFSLFRVRLEHCALQSQAVSSLEEIWGIRPGEEISTNTDPLPPATSLPDSTRGLMPW